MGPDYQAQICPQGKFSGHHSKGGISCLGAIYKAKEQLKDGFQSRLGAGNVSFWFHSWSDLGLLHHLLPYIDIHDQDLKVKDVFVN